MTEAQNAHLALRLREAAALLEQQGANPFRVNAYRKAAATLDALPQDVGLILKTDGFDGIRALPGIGRMIGGAIVEMLRTGQWPQLERLRGSVNPEALLRKVPGVGSTLARRIIDTIHVETLEDLEIAAHDGRLATVPAFGPRRIAIVRSALAEIIGRDRSPAEFRAPEPSVEILLEVDREYRTKAMSNQLHRIAPRRFNPSGAAWLPILHTERGEWRFTALFSNTAQAHRFDRTFDWVVIYFHTDSEREGQRTIVQETSGPLRGRRVVRGREIDCLQYYHPHQLTLPLNAA